MYGNEENHEQKPLTLKERIQLAKEHASREKQTGNVLWGHQRFALTIGELLDAAELSEEQATINKLQEENAALSEALVMERLKFWKWQNL